ncbi:MAG: HIT domain-containing protein [Spirochaetes bacterium]|nr:HIT domain-containing protein [Spirochaetota bacterium]
MEYFFNFDKVGYLKGSRPKGCILCLIREDSPDVDKLVVYESLFCVATLNLYPYNPGHLLVFPKRHLTDVRSLGADEKGDLDRTRDLCLDALDKVMAPQGYNIGFNQGLAAGGSIEHLHLHIIPRYKNELGIADLIGGKKVLVQNPLETQARLREALGS